MLAENLTIEDFHESTGLDMEEIKELASQKG
jgi:hypothetical protein